MKLEKKVRTHDWTSMEPYDLLERIEIVQKLIALPQNKLSEILNTLPPQEAADLILRLEDSIKEKLK